jgi:membrane protein implicated in regulation of membrane protease activity
MNMKALNFWTLILVSLLLAMLAISLFYWALKAVVYLLLVLILTPIIYLVLRRMVRPRILTQDDEKLKNRK